VRYFRALSQSLRSTFSERELVLVPIEDRGTTGRFEIIIKNTGELIHSKSTRGQGRCDRPGETEAVAAAIGNYINRISK
jgi:hypothetical protein